MSELTPEAFGENGSIILASQPAPGADWRDDEGWGWVFKAWFETRAQAASAHAAIESGGWQAARGRWSRKVAVRVGHGHEGARLTRFVLDRFPSARIQLRND